LPDCRSRWASFSPMPPLLTNSNASCRSEKLTAIVPPQSSRPTTWTRRPACQWDRPVHCHHCRHDDWPETFWTGLIDRLARDQAHAGKERPAFSHIRISDPPQSRRTVCRCPSRFEPFVSFGVSAAPSWSTRMWKPHGTPKASFSVAGPMFRIHLSPAESR
jgi:hypothetical protein